MADNCAMIAGHDSCATSRSRWPVVSGAPDRNISDKSAAKGVGKFGSWEVWGDFKVFNVLNVLNVLNDFKVLKN